MSEHSHIERKMENFSERQQQIINAAIELIAEKGIQQLTIKNLSKKIGVVEGAIYRHFDSKINIILGILSVFKQSKNGVMDILNAELKSPLHQLQTLFIERFKYFTKNPAIAAVIFSEEIFQNEKQLSVAVFAIMNESQQVIHKLIEKGQESGQIRPDILPEQLSLIITGAIRLIVTKWRLSGFAFDLEKDGLQLWQSLKRILEK